jgi:hypothetical protein
MALVTHRVAALLCAIALGLPLAAQSPRASGVQPFIAVDSPVVALTHARIVDGTGTPARDDHTLVLRGGRIESIGPAASTPPPAGSQVIDLSGHTILPGFVGLHEHTYFGGVRRITQMRISGPRLYLAYGVTTAMTAGAQFPYDELNMKRAIDAGTTPGPRFEITGPYFSGGPPRNSTNRLVTSVEEVRRVVAYWASEGATWFKFLGTVPRHIMRAGIHEAHARGLRVTGHLCSVTFSEAAADGIDALQHGFITNSDYVSGKKPDVCPPENMRAQADVDVDSPAVQANIRAIAATGTAVVSTLAVYETFVPERARLDPRAMELLDPEVRREVEASHAALGQGGLSVPPRLLAKMMKWERSFVAAGGLLGAGSDPWGTGLLPGIGNLRNFELLVEAGFTPVQAIQICTLNGARILGHDARTGSIAPGKAADLIVIRGNPVAVPSDIYTVVTVFKEGVGYDSAKLRDAAKALVGVF